MASDTLLVLDGMSLLSRAYHALPPLNAPDGTPTGAIQGFLQTLLKWYDAYRPTHVAVAFDRPGGTFRHRQFEPYKAHRKPADPELVQQFAIAEEMLGDMGIQVLGMPDFEADDIIGTLREMFRGCGGVVVVSGDRDLLQLVDASCEMVLARSSLGGAQRYTPDKVRAEFGVYPAQVPDLKGLMGDASDGIPGVPGIGEKTAVRLLRGVNTLDELLALAVVDGERIEPLRIRVLLETYRDQAMLSKDLATIRRDVQFDELAGIGVDALRWSLEDVSEPAWQEIRQLGMHSVAARWGRVAAELAGATEELGLFG